MKYQSFDFDYKEKSCSEWKKNHPGIEFITHALSTQKNVNYDMENNPFHSLWSIQDIIRTFGEDFLQCKIFIFIILSFTPQ